MAKKKGKLKKAQNVAHPKKKAKAAPKGKATATPKKKAKALPAKKVKGAPKGQAKKKAPAGKAPKKATPTKKKTQPTKAKIAADFSAAFDEALPANRLRKALRALPHSQLCAYLESHGYDPASKKNIHDLIEDYIKELREVGIERVEDEYDDPDNEIEEALEEVEGIASEAAELRQRVADLLNKLNDGALQWLHFEMTDPDAEGEITTDEEADEARENFPPLNRPALVQELTAIAVDEFQLADEPDLAETLRDENSIRGFLTSNKN